jgi:hypothetical protein
LKASGGTTSRRAFALEWALPLVPILTWLARGPQRALAACAPIDDLLAKGLRKVLELLEDAGLSIPQAVADRLRRAPDFTGTASLAQFWSVFLLYGLLAVQTSVALCVMLVVLAALALPMTALAVRRVRAMTWIEVLTISAVVVFIAADIFVL